MAMEIRRKLRTLKKNVETGTLKRIVYKTTGVCSTKILIFLEGNIIHFLKFAGGCQGQSEAVSRLVIGKTCEDVISLLKGINCENRGTSCSDQLCEALEKHLKGQI